MRTSEQMLTWVESLGGPLLILPENLYGYWNGQDSEKNDVSDYLRACDANDYLELIEVGEKFGLVLGGDPCPTTIFKSPITNHLIVARWIWAETDESAQKTLFSANFINCAGEDLNFDITSPKLFLLDPVYSCKEKHGILLEQEIDIGKYVIRTFDFKPDANTWFVIHIFLRAVETIEQRSRKA